MCVSIELHNIAQSETLSCGPQCKLLTFVPPDGRACVATATATEALPCLVRYRHKKKTFCGVHERHHSRSSQQHFSPSDFLVQLVPAPFDLCLPEGMPRYKTPFIHHHQMLLDTRYYTRRYSLFISINSVTGEEPESSCDPEPKLLVMIAMTTRVNRLG